MLKKMIGVGAAMAFLLPVAAFAAVDITFLTVDGGANTSVDEGDNVTAKVTYDITGSTDVESISWELVGSDLPQQCVNVTDDISNGTHTSTFNMDTAGASEGSWDVLISTYGDDAANASNLCESSDQSDSATFGDRITVEDGTDDNQNGNGGNTGGNSALDALTAAVAALAAQVNAILHPVTPPAPTTSAACTAWAAASVGTMQGARNDANVRLQGFLLSQGASIPWLAAGASFGFYGPQTAAANVWFNSLNHCN